MVTLQNISEDNYRECLNIKVSENQKKFISEVSICLSKAYVFYDTVKPFAICNNDIVVGFIMVRFNEKINNYFIWQFMIDEKYQGKGYGRKALELIIKWIKENKDGKEITTTYIEGNSVVRDLYKSFGFKEFNNEDGEVDMILHI